MKGILIFLLTIGLFLLSASAEGADWKLIATSKEGDTLYIDTGSIRHISKTVVRAWTKQVLKKPELSGSKEIVESLGYEEYDCAEMKKHNLQITFRYSDGTSDSITNPNPAKDWSYITPDTVNSAIPDYLCKKGK